MTAPRPMGFPPVMQAASPQAPVMQPASPRRAPAVMGASGNVGASAVARMLDTTDSGSWRTDVVGPLPLPDVLVAGVSVQAMDRARQVLALLSQMGARPVLVIVSDGHGRPPADSRALRTLLAPLVREVVDMPYVPAWRACTSPSGLTPPTGAALSAVNRLRAAFGLAPVPPPRRRR